MSNVLLKFFIIGYFVILPIVILIMLIIDRYFGDKFKDKFDNFFSLLLLFFLFVYSCVCISLFVLSLISLRII